MGLDCRLGGDRVEAEMAGAVVGNAGEDGEVLAVADAFGVLVSVAGDHRNGVVVILARPEYLEIGHYPMSMPRCLATVKTSLSPRPQRFMTMIWSLPMVGASLITSASACAGSSAGMMPSIRVQSWKAPSASLSVAGT